MNNEQVFLRIQSTHFILKSLILNPEGKMDKKNKQLTRKHEVSS